MRNPIKPRLTSRPVGISRREFIQAGALGTVGFSSFARLSSAHSLNNGNVTVGRSVILIVNVGGPSQLETFDPKPDAPAEIRGPFRSISTKVPGVMFSELLPQHARIADKFSIVRSCYHSQPATHEAGQEFMLTGGPSPFGKDRCPTIGEVVSSSREPKNSLPVAVTLPVAKYFGLDRLESSQMNEVLDIQREPLAVRESYGRSHIGESCLAARRCVEAGVSLVTLYTFSSVFHRATWDVHGGAPYTSFAQLRNIVAPMYDQAYVALVEDLETRGLLANTLVCGVAEFGRTPQINATGGRDHWTHCFSTTFAGGDVQGGRTIGTSDSIGAFPTDRPITPPEIVATIYQSLGMEPVANPIQELF